MPKVFISYRRSDTQYVAKVIYDRLVERFGKESVYYDIDVIPAGVDFRHHIRQAVGECDVLLAVIGDRWQALDERGEIRLNNPADFVRIEIAAALARDILVVPVLLESAQVPRENELPGELADLAYRNACEVRAGSSMEGDLHRLISGVEHALSSVDSESRVAQFADISGAESSSIEVPKWASAADEDQYGRWVAFEVGGQQYRMRWIEPGEFLMGSPEDEPERWDDEALHTVRLTSGFWLSETVVNQTLWQLVTGNNPSHFKGENLPVGSSGGATSFFVPREYVYSGGKRSPIPEQVRAANESGEFVTLHTLVRAAGLSSHENVSCGRVCVIPQCSAIGSHVQI